ncbi:hypothetical protein ADUPG1_006782, partial [Aduncisulcus paluster]
MKPVIKIGKKRVISNKKNRDNVTSDTVKSTEKDEQNDLLELVTFDEAPEDPVDFPGETESVKGKSCGPSSCVDKKTVKGVPGGQPLSEADLSVLRAEPVTSRERSRLLVLSSKDIQAPRGRAAVYKLVELKSASVLAFCNQCLDLLKTDIHCDLPCLNSLIESNVLRLISVKTHTKYRGDCEDPEYVKQCLQGMIDAYASKKAFGQFVEEAQLIKCECTGDYAQEDEVGPYMVEFTRLLDSCRAEALWSVSQQRRAVDLMVKGLRPVLFSEKVASDVEELRRYGESGSGTLSTMCATSVGGVEPEGVRLQGEGILEVSAYVLELANEASNHFVRGRAYVGLNGSDKRRASAGVSSDDDSVSMDRKKRASVIFGRHSREVDGSAEKELEKSESLFKPACVYCGSAQHFVWECVKYLRVDRVRRVIPEARWEVYRKGLSACGLESSLPTLSRFREAIAPEEDWARSHPEPKPVKPPVSHVPVSAHREAKPSGGHRRSVSRPAGRPPQWQPISDVKCTRCGQLGHFRRWCRNTPLPPEEQERLKAEVANRSKVPREYLDRAANAWRRGEISLCVGREPVEGSDEWCRGIYKWAEAERKLCNREPAMADSEPMWDDISEKSENSCEKESEREIADSGEGKRRVYTVGFRNQAPVKKQMTELERDVSGFDSKREEKAKYFLTNTDLAHGGERVEEAVRLADRELGDRCEKILMNVHGSSKKRDILDDEIP